MLVLAALIAVTAVWGLTFVQAKAPLAAPAIRGRADMRGAADSVSK